MTSSAPKPRGFRARQERYFEAFDVLRLGRDSVLLNADRRRSQAELAAMPLDVDDPDDEGFVDAGMERDQALERLRHVENEYRQLVTAWESTMTSFSWRITRPLRDLKARLQRLLH